MTFFKIIRVAIRAITVNKMRTLLTMLGVIIGVGAIIAMLSLAEGTKRQVTESIMKMGTNLLRVRPGAARLGHVAVGTVETLTMEDARVIENAVDGITRISPAVSNPGQVKYANKNASTLVRGTTPEFMEMNNFELSEGRLFTDREVKLMKRVAAIGNTVKEELFGEGVAVGKKVRIEGQSFLVVGVMKPKGQTSWRDPDDQVFVPITTSQKRLFDQGYLNDIYIQVEDVDQRKEIKSSITRILRARHRIMDNDEADFSIRDYTEFISTLKETARTFTVLLGGTAAVSLLVGGIGVMNIMLVSVTERTREIGLRMAVGARRRDIMRQFLIEAVVLSVAGGVLGIGFGSGLAWGIALWGGWETAVTPISIALSFFFSVIVGVVFGLYPARKASRMDPIEALRYE